MGLRSSILPGRVWILRAHKIEVFLHKSHMDFTHAFVKKTLSWICSVGNFCLNMEDLAVDALIRIKTDNVIVNIEYLT